MAAKISSLQDIPVLSKEEELLGLDVYAHALSEFIKNCDTPITIGIQGDWGIGKTSLLNLIRENLRSKQGWKKSFTIVPVETWQFSQFQQEEFLPLAVLNAINESLIEGIPDEAKQSEYKKNFRNILKKTGSFLANVANQVVKEKVGIDTREALQETNGQGSPITYMDMAREVIKIKEAFTKVVEEIVPNNDGSKVVVLIDDLDRIRPIKALELLEVIKVFLDVPKCVFVLAVDYSVIERGAEQKLGRNFREFYGKSFFDKIIQVPFNMPVTSYRTDRYIMSMFGWPYDPKKDAYIYDKEKGDTFLARTNRQDLGQKEADFFSNITKLSAGNNPRTIKRIVNYANLLKLICTSSRQANKSERATWTINDAKIVYAIACMQLTWPELFQFFAQNPSPSILQRLEDMNFLGTIPDLKRMFSRYPDPHEIQSKISGFFDEFIAVIDQNGNNEISTDEFMPIWKVLQDTNLTSVPLESPEEQWKNFEEIVESVNKKWKGETIQGVMNLFKKSNWYNSLSLRVIPAGKKFSNVLWNQVQIGSLVSTQAEPIQFYLNEVALPASGLTQSLSERSRAFLEDCSDQRHYGTGNLKLKLQELAGEKDGIQIMNEIIRQVNELI